jgi:hypothetical protein
MGLYFLSQYANVTTLMYKLQATPLLKSHIWLSHAIFVVDVEAARWRQKKQRHCNELAPITFCPRKIRTDILYYLFRCDDPIASCYQEQFQTLTSSI